MALPKEHLGAMGSDMCICVSYFTIRSQDDIKVEAQVFWGGKKKNGRGEEGREWGGMGGGGEERDRGENVRW